MNWRLGAALAALALVSTVPAGAADLGVSHGVQVAGLFGESDDEKAARLKAEQRENDQDSGIADLRQRVQDLEQTLRQITGQNEQLAHQIRDLNAQIQQERKDFDYKLCTLMAQQMGAGTQGGASGLPCDAAAVGAPPAQGEQMQNSGAPPPAASGSTLGTLPVGQAQAPATRSQYDEAMNLLARARYDEARAAFRAFADSNPKDSLAPQAVYWVGNIAFVQKDYAAAAQAFAEQIKKYPSSQQSPESMLKLGQSLIALGEKKEGCLTLGAIKTKYKQAPANILTQAASVRTASCSK